jgi:pilus assembly protein CpaF
MIEVLRGAVIGKLNILVSGGTGSGKTTLLNLLSGYIPDDERIVTIEDSAELQLQQSHTVRLETRPPNIEGKGEISQRDLVKNCLRMRPDRIVIGEVRGGEALDMLAAMNTGHEGSLTTLHANSPRDALARLEYMVCMAGFDMPVSNIRTQIASAIDLVVQLNRQEDGRRRITSIQEINGMEGDIITMSEIFSFTREGKDSEGNILGHFNATGIIPGFHSKLKLHGIDLPLELFNCGDSFADY